MANTEITKVEAKSLIYKIRRLHPGVVSEGSDITFLYSALTAISAEDGLCGLGEYRLDCAFWGVEDNERSYKFSADLYHNFFLNIIQSERVSSEESKKAITHNIELLKKRGDSDAEEKLQFLEDLLEEF